MAENPRFENETHSWYTQPGPHSDVVVSSRIRLARNLVEYPFPETMSEETEARVRDEIIAAFHKLPEPLTTVYLDQIPVNDRNLLLEKHFVTSEFAKGKNKALVLGVDERFAAMVNEGDHLRLAVIRSGLALRDAYAEADRIDTALEEHLNYAASLEWGYLNAAFSDIGTGMRASVMVHLPGMVADATIEEALKTARELGFRVKGYPGEGDKSLGDMYQLSNATSLGAGESEILERMEMMTRELADAERKARQALLQRKGWEVEDRICRALGTLRSARLISTKEAIELLTQVRWGISAGLVREVGLEEVTALLFRTQVSHTRKLLHSGSDEADRNLLDFTRAGFIRQALGGM